MHAQIGLNDAFTVAASGARINLAAPDPAAIRLSDIADGLAQINRWAGATVPSPFTVAQHSCIVADEMYRAADAMGGIYGLLHDGHEFVVGDIVVPTQRALDHLMRNTVSSAIGILKDRLDDAIHRRFGLDWPPPAPIVKQLALAHERVVITEMKDLTRGREPEIAALEARGVQRLPTFIRARTAPLAREAFLARFENFTTVLGLRRADQGGLL